MPRLLDTIFLFTAILASSWLLAFAVLAGIDTNPRRDRVAGSVWRLRSSPDGPLPTTEDPALRLRLAEEVPEERRVVRVVYPGLTGPR